MKAILLLSGGTTFDDYYFFGKKYLDISNAFLFTNWTQVSRFVGRIPMMEEEEEAAIALFSLTVRLSDTRFSLLLLLLVLMVFLHHLHAMPAIDWEEEAKGHAVRTIVHNVLNKTCTCL